jgi:hypothetical protein
MELWDKADPAPAGILPPWAAPAGAVDLAEAGGGDLEFYPHPAGVGHVLSRRFPDGHVEWRQR